MSSERDRLWQALDASMSGAPRLLETPKPAKPRRWWQFWQADDAAPKDATPSPAGGRTSPASDRDYGDLEHLIGELSQVSRTLQNMALQSVFLGQR